MEGKRDLSDVFTLLTICGILSGSQGNSRMIFTLFQMSRAILTVVGFVMSFISVYMSGIKDSLSKYAFFCAAGFFLAIQAVSFWLNRQLIEKTILSIKALVEKRTEPWQLENFKNISRKIWLGLYICIYLCVFFSIVYYFLPLGYDIYLCLFSNSTEPYSLPLPNKIISGTEPPSRSLSYYSITLFIILWGNHLCFTSVGYFALLYFLILYICNEMNIISENIHNWGNIYNRYNWGNIYNRYNWGNIYNSYNYEYEAKLTLKIIVQDHQEVIKLGPALRDILGLPFMAHSLIGPMSLTLFLYTVSIQLKKDLILVLVNSFCVMCVSFLLFMSCLAGEILQSQSFKIFESLCTIPWYEMSPKIREDLNMMVRQAVKPMTIHYKRRYFINLRSFMQVLNSSYSYLMVLNSMN